MRAPAAAAMTFSSPAPAGEQRPDAATGGAAEAELVRASVAGDTNAFAALVRLHSARVFNFLYQMTRQRQDAEDLAQQTFVKAYRNLHRFDASRPLINWVLTIARRTALNHFRSAKKWESAEVESADRDPSPDRRAEARDQVETLWARARRVLSQREYEILWLRFAEDLSIEETARVAGLTKTHVKILVFRARKRLMAGAASA